MLGALAPKHYYGDAPRGAPASRPSAHPCDVYPILWFTTPLAKPQAFRSIDAVAKALIRAADGAPLDGGDQTIGFAGDIKTRRVVAVWTLTDGGSRNLYLGYVWLGGRDRGHAALKAALQDLEVSRWAA